MNLLTAILLMAAGFVGAFDARPVSKPKFLNIGDPAPPIKVGKWIKGKPVKELAKGHVYVVEFWATWCGAPCQNAAIHLSELATQYEGKVTFIGVAIMENNAGLGLNKDGILAKVEKFVEKMNDKINYTLAVDNYDDIKGDNTAFMYKNWFNAAGESGIPLAFVVGKDGNIAWIGVPSQLDGVLDDIIAGKFENKELAADRRKEKQPVVQKHLKYQKIMERIDKPFRAGKFKEALAELEKIEAAYPTYKEQLAFRRFRVLLKTNETKAYTLARELADGEYKDQPTSLVSLALEILDAKDLKKPDYEIALMIAEKAVSSMEAQSWIQAAFIAQKIPQFKPVLFATLAKAQFKHGDTSAAVESMEKAVAECETLSETLGSVFLKNLKIQLEQYRNRSHPPLGAISTPIRKHDTYRGSLSR